MTVRGGAARGDAVAEPDAGGVGAADAGVGVEAVGGAAIEHGEAAVEGGVESMPAVVLDVRHDGVAGRGAVAAEAAGVHGPAVGIGEDPGAALGDRRRRGVAGVVVWAAFVDGAVAVVVDGVGAAGGVALDAGGRVEVERPAAAEFGCGHRRRVSGGAGGERDVGGELAPAAGWRGRGEALVGGAGVDAVEQALATVADMAEVAAGEHDEREQSDRFAHQ
ncbi:MAG: hypothetical protein R3F65_21155 [bacterium]